MAEITCPLKESVSISGKEPALIQGSSVVLYSQLDVFVSATACRMLEIGIQPGDTILLRLQHRMRAVVILLAAWRMGAIAHPVQPKSPPFRLFDLLRLSACPWWLDDYDFEEAIPEGVLRLSSDDVIRKMVEDTSIHLSDGIELSRPATAIETSGTGGQPKVALISHANHYYSTLGANRELDLHSSSRWLMNLPLYHVGGLAIMHRCVKAGACMVFAQKDMPIAQVLKQQGITHISVVPTQLHRYLEDPETVAALATLQVILVGGAPLPARLQDRCLAAKLPIVVTYGLTETASMVTAQNPRLSLEGRATSGAPLRYREVKISDDGEVLVRGSICITHYLTGGGTETSVDTEGWIHTGDMGSLDANGRLRISGRKDFMFISGGENIYPEQIEDALLRLSWVHQAVVVPLDDAEFGRRPGAFLDRASSACTDEQIRSALEEFLPRFMIPKKFYPWPEEANEGLKINRKWFLERIEN